MIDGGSDSAWLLMVPAEDLGLAIGITKSAGARAARTPKAMRHSPPRMASLAFQDRLKRSPQRTILAEATPV